MKKEEIIEQLLQEKIIAIVRLAEQDQVMDVVRGLVAGGIRALEITSNTPGFCDAITSCRTLYPEVLIGAGTVINRQITVEVLEAGAQFIVTPNCDTEVIKVAHQYHVPVVMGALTPTEVCLAMEHGADIVKLFPAGAMGINYFKAVRGPLNNVPFFVVGGITVENVRDWIEAGALGVGVGNVLTHSGLEVNDFEKIRKTTQAFINELK